MQKVVPQTLLWPTTVFPRAASQVVELVALRRVAPRPAAQRTTGDIRPGGGTCRAATSSAACSGATNSRETSAHRVSHSDRPLVRGRSCRSATTATLICLALWLGLGLTHAATLTVLNNNDAGAGSLRQVIAAAVPDDTITFDNALTGSTIVLTSGELLIDKSVTIAGLGADKLAIDGNYPVATNRVIHVSPGVTATIAGLTITNGNTPTSFNLGGGGIWNQRATLTVSNCTVTGNYIANSGGGIFNDGENGSATMHVINSTVSGNSVGNSGGGVWNDGNNGSATLTIVNSTISGNSARTQGGAIWNYAGDTGVVTLEIVNSTLSENSARFGGGFTQYKSSLTIGNTILNNTTGGNIDNLSGTVTSHGYNLSSDAGGGFLTATGDQTNTPPLLGPLQLNGGSTLTHALLPGSPAIDAGDPAFVPPPDFDQRGAGFPRVSGRRIDIGAFEVQDSSPPEITCPSDIVAAAPPSQSSAVVTYDVTATDDFDPNPTVSCDPPSGSIFPQGVTIVMCIASDASGNTNECSFTVAVSTSFVTDKQLGGLRNNFSGLAGMKFTVGNSPVIVTHLGRIFVTGNTGVHLVKIVRASDLTDVGGAAVNISMPGGVASQFKYEQLSSAVTLLANTMYYLVSQETAGGDFWYDVNTTVTTKPIAVVNSGVFMGGGYPWSNVGGMNQCYVPVDFQWTLGSGAPPQPPSVTITNPLSAATFTAPANILIQVATSPGVTNVEFFQNGSSLGSDSSSPFSFNWNNVLAGNYALRAKATDGGGLMSTSAVVNISVTTNQPGSDVAYVTSAAVGALRNNFSGLVGAKITVAANPIMITALGRMVFTGNAGSHLVKIVRASDNVDVPGASVVISMAGAVNGQFQFAVLPAPVTLAANTMYYVVSQETAGGDRWSDLDTAVTTTPVAALNSAVYFGSGFGWTVAGGGNQTFVPINFRYQVGGGPPMPIVAITNPPEGAIFTLPTNVTINAAASAGITNVEFFQDSMSLGQDNTAPFSLIWSNPPVGHFALTAKATDTNGQMAFSSVVNITVTTNTPRGGMAFVENKTLGTLRNNFNGFVGMKITVGPEPIRVLQLGRICATGNSGTHLLKLVRASDLTDVPNGSAVLNLTGCGSGDFAYVALATPVVLSANTMYYLVSQETVGGDLFYDVENTAVTTKGVAVVNGGVYQGGGYPWTAVSTAGRTYVPVDFRFDPVTVMMAGALLEQPFTAGDGEEVIDATLQVNVRAGMVELTLVGSSGRTYQVEISDDLGGWRAMGRYTVGAEPVIIPDESALSARRFYRAVLLGED